jgi:hypothetical protein
MLFKPALSRTHLFHPKLSIMKDALDAAVASLPDPVVPHVCSPWLRPSFALARKARERASNVAKSGADGASDLVPSLMEALRTPITSSPESDADSIWTVIALEALFEVRSLAKPTRALPYLKGYFEHKCHSRNSFATCAPCAIALSRGGRGRKLVLLLFTALALNTSRLDNQFYRFAQARGSQ